MNGVGRRLTTGPLSSSSSPSHLLALMGGLGATTAGFFVVSSSEASQSDITKLTQGMRKRKGKSKREWIEIRSKVLVGFHCSLSSRSTGIAGPLTVVTRKPAPSRDVHSGEGRASQTCFASRQEPWLYSKCTVSCCDALALWEPHGSVERHGC